MTERAFFGWFMAAWCLVAAACFAALFFVAAPYGKFTRRGFGPTIDRSFGWLLMEFPAFAGMIFFFLIGDRRESPVAIAFLVLWEIHYVNRALVFPFRMRGERQGVTLLTVLLGFAFNLGNSYLNGRYLFSLDGIRPVAWLGDPRFLVGALLFAVGYGINVHSDAVLRSLRKPGETGYVIPRAGLFRYVTAANYFGEIVEWLGWSVATWSPAGLVFLLWTVANLLPRAVAQHRWYRQHFSDYPAQRRILVPFLF